MSEKILHKQVCQYIRIQFPGVLFNSDLAGSMRLTIGQAVALKSLRSSRGFPDLVIYEPKGEYHALFLELKAEGTKVIKMNGEWATPHIAEQAYMIERLKKLGYCALFAIDFDHAKKIIDQYMKL